MGRMELEVECDGILDESRGIPDAHLSLWGSMPAKAIMMSLCFRANAANSSFEVRRPPRLASQSTVNITKPIFRS